MVNYDLSDFGHITSARELVSTKVAVSELPTIEQVKTLAKWSEEMLERFDRDAAFFEGPPKQDRSGAMGAFAYLCAEHGWADEQIMAALLDIDDRWGKYKERRDRTRRLIDFINRARQKVGYGDDSELELSGLIRGKDLAVIDPDVSKLVYGFQDFVEAEFPINWMLKDLLAAQGFGLLVAHPGVGKTTLALQMGAHLSLGYDTFLKWENLSGAKKVLFVSLEMGKAPFHHFITQIAPNYEDRNKLNRNFLLAPLGTPLPLDTKEGQAFMNNLMDEYKPDLLMIDSLQKVSSKELTDEQAVKNLIHYLSTLRDRYQTAILVVHHNRKKPNDAQKKSVELSDVYGSTYITTDVDFVMNLHMLSTDLVAVTMLKNRLGPTPEPFEIVRDSHMNFTLDFEGLMNNFHHEKKEDPDGFLGI